MLCPNCKREMIVVEHQSVELDYCTRCQGVWFDAGEIELFLRTAKREEPDVSLEVMRRLPEVKGARHRKCPICRRRMREVAVSEPAINVDVCIRGDGVWFDSGEVQQLLSQLAEKTLSAEGESQLVFTFIGETFKARQ